MIARFCTIDAVPDTVKNGVVAIGNFDGVHRGHQAVLHKAMELLPDGPHIALTFEPHPRSVFRPDSPVPRITPATIKAEILGALGFGAVFEIPFDTTFASQTADTFVSTILCGVLDAQHVVTGVDFHFGKNRQGGPAYLMDAGREKGFGVTLVDAYRDENAEIISSSRIRDHLFAGELIQANGLLGYRYRVRGTVSAGKQLGRTLGYPTANMAMPDTMPLAHGIYAVRIRDMHGIMRDGVANFGRRPTVDHDGEVLLETYIFDFSGDLYGQEADIIFCAHLRAEEKFDTLDALIAQMQKDESEARAVLATLQPLSALDDQLCLDKAGA